MKGNTQWWQRKTVRNGDDDDDRIETSSLQPPSRDEHKSSKNSKNPSKTSNEGEGGGHHVATTTSGITTSVEPSSATNNAKSGIAKGIDYGMLPAVLPRNSFAFAAAKVHDDNDTQNQDAKKSKKDDDLKHHQPQLICINNDEEEQTECNEVCILPHALASRDRSSMGMRTSSTQQSQSLHPGAVAVRGPGLINSSDQSTTGTIIIGGDGVGEEQTVSSSSSMYHETTSSPNLAIAAEIAPSGEDIIARMEEQMESEIERRVREHFQQVLQQTPRAEAVAVLESSTSSTNNDNHVRYNEERNESATTTGMPTNKNNPPPLHKYHHKRKKSKDACWNVKFKPRWCKGSNASKRHRIVMLLGLVMVIVMVVVVGVVVSTRGSKTDGKTCTKDSECNLSHAVGICVNGTCLIDTCQDNYGNCDGKSSTGCNTNLQTDVNHCGSCGKVCSLANAESKCDDGLCSVRTCLDGFANCDGMSSTGCNTNLQTDVDHCGSCGKTCNLTNAESKCDDGSCSIMTCLDGFVNCDGKSSTGCNTNLKTDRNFCGSCSNKCVPSESCANGVCEISVQRLALMSLYESTNGLNWKSDAKEGWSSFNVNECDWDGVLCNTNGKVISLDKSWMNLKGKLPTELGKLTELTDLDLLSNLLTGSIPTELGKLTELTDLDLSDNLLAGNIPTEFGKLTNLKSLVMYQNGFTGALPSEIGRMSNLRVLHVYENHLDSIPSEICSMDLTLFWTDCSVCHTYVLEDGWTEKKCCTKCGLR